ncbi:MAG TPA: YfhO family protein [Flavobacteriaceae bacterium]|nr:YfhO family protein [Flavobacteriaceae bacterium]
MNNSYKKFIPHILVVLAFIVIAVAYFNPVLRGKVIYQSDIVHYIGMAQEQIDFRKKTHEEPFWTDAAFGGMPTYQLGAQYPNDYIDQFDDLLRFLPRPADYLFLYFIGLYLLLLVLKVDYKLAFLGALAFGFSTYLIVILGVGHNSKAHAIAYMPWVLAGILLIFRNVRVWGFFLLTIGMALQLNANHFQMTYYLLILVIILGIAFLIDAFKRKKLPEFFTSVGIMIIAVVLSLATNATNLLATQEYMDFSTRGDTGLTLEGEQKESGGLDYEYITSYSYGILESFNLFIPRFMGGSNAEKLDANSEVYQAIQKLGASPLQAKDFVKSAPTYWGNQPYVAAPAYIGATVLFLFVLALFLVRGRFKWWIVGGSLLALVLSWGDNWEFLTRFFINYVPFYDKFRAVTSIQVIIELCVPVFAIVGLCKLFGSQRTKDEKLHALKWSVIITGGIALFFLLFKSILFDFSGENDVRIIQQLGPDFMRALQEDRKAIFTSDTLRSLILLLLIAGIIWYYLKGKVSKNMAIGGFAILILFDLVGVDRRYVNNDDFVSSRQMETPFQPNSADLQILKDKGHFRVLDLSVDPFNSSRASFFHNSIGGYHGAKPGRIQELYSHYILQGNNEVLNMLNTKYLILENQGQIFAQMNSEANGNAWFVDSVKIASSVNEAFLSLGKINTKTTAVVNEKFSDHLKKTKFQTDSTARINLVSYEPNELKYEYSVSDEQLAVFSEIYYPHGWNAYVDGKKQPHFRADYVLRAMVLPAGTHELIFKFEPEVVKTGSTIVLISCILIGLLFLAALFITFRKKEIPDKKN